MRGARHRDREVQLWLSYLDLIRLTVQCTNTWIETELQRLAADASDVLRTERSEYSDAVCYYARQLPNN